MSNLSGCLSQDHVVKRLVTTLVESRNHQTNEFDKNHMKTLKNFMKNDQNLCESLISSLFTALHRADSDIRLSAVLLCDEFFTRMHKFRQNLIDDFQDFLLLTAETDPLKYALPPPKEAAKELKKETLKLVHKWYEKYGPAYRKLELAYNFLKQSKSLDFERLETETYAERQRVHEEEERKERIRSRLREKIEEEFNDLQPDIVRCLTELQNGFQLLYPDFNRGQSDVVSNDNNEKTQMQLHGFSEVNRSVQIQVNFENPHINTSEDNETLICAICDCAKLMRHSYLVQINKLLTKLTKIGGLSCENLAKKIIQIKTELDSALKQFDDLKLVTNKSSKRIELSESSEESDLEDVPEKKELQHSFDDDTVPQYILDHSKKRLNSLSDQIPSTSGTAVSSKSDVSTVSFGLDLKYWGADKIDTVTPISNESGFESFWSKPTEKESAGGGSAVLSETYRTRVIPFVGRYEPIEKECGELMSNGKICRRRDKLKCPFHGAMGNKSRDQPSTSWQDPELQKDIEAATGVKLTIEKKGKRRKKREISDSKKTRIRLETKLFDRKSLKRISSTLDQMQQARNQRKFESQFNYHNHLP